MLDRKWLRLWIAASNSVVILLLAWSAYNRYRQLTILRRLVQAGSVPARDVIRSAAPVLCIILLLVLGIMIEFTNRKWAWLINAGFYWFVFVTGLWQSVRAYPGSHPNEVMIGVILIVIPSGVIALMTTLLYALSRRTSPPAAAS
jgi:hypothetical protein